MIERQKYLDRLIACKDNGMPKVITGIRRCGKTYLLTNIFRRYLLSIGVPNENIIMLSMDDDSCAEYLNPLVLGKYVRELCKGKERCYVFIDEIQMVHSIVSPAFTEGKIVEAKEGDTAVVTFVQTVLGLSREPNIDLYVTGSNSKMLSTDIVTEFRDKAININMGPLSFSEFYNYVGGSRTEALNEYMQYGGMPGVVVSPREEKPIYLKNLFSTTYFKDIIERNYLRRSDALEKLATLVAETCGELMNGETLARRFNAAYKGTISGATIASYLYYFQDSFLLREVKRFDIKGKRGIGAQKKYYFSDTGLRNARLDFVFPDRGQMLENVVYNELVGEGYSVSVGSFDSWDHEGGKSIRKSYEIDFYAVKGIRKYYIQVCDDISSAETHAREVKPFSYLDDEIQKIVVINDDIGEMRDINGYTVIGATDFLLRFIK